MNTIEDVFNSTAVRSSGAFTLPGTSLAPGLYYFTVVASQGTPNAQFPFDYRTLSLTTQVILTGTTAPAVAIVTSPKGRVTRSQTFDLRATVAGGTAGLSLQWSAARLLTDVDDDGQESVTSTAVSGLFLAPATALHTRVAGAPLLNGAVYAFRFTATDTFGRSAWQEVRVSVNSAPYRGTLWVSPTTGTSLTTAFKFRAADWADPDEDYPLSYVFGFRKSPGANATLYTLSSLSTIDTLLDRLLPAGSEPGYKVYPTVTVHDALGARTQADTITTWGGEDLIPSGITIHPLAATGRDLARIIQNNSDTLLEADLLAGTIDSVMMNLNTLALVLNQAGSGETACGSLPFCGVEVEGIDVLSGTCVEGTCVCRLGYTGANCSLAPTPVDGGYSEWSEWSPCEGEPCETVIQTRTRTCTNPVPLHGGLTCEEQSLGPRLETRTCEVTEGCPSRPPVVRLSSWSQWSTCSVACDPAVGGAFTGWQTRGRYCIFTGGTNAPPDPDSVNLNGTESDIEQRYFSSVCDDSLVDARVCAVDCPYPLKRCLGDSEGVDALGQPLVECSGHGQCRRSNPRCRSNDLSCSHYCMCEDGWSGGGCRATEAEHDALVEARSKLLQLQAKALRETEVTTDEMVLVVSQGLKVSRGCYYESPLGLPVTQCCCCVGTNE